MKKDDLVHADENYYELYPAIKFQNFHWRNQVYTFISIFRLILEYAIFIITNYVLYFCFRFYILS